MSLLNLSDEELRVRLDKVNEENKFVTDEFNRRRKLKSDAVEARIRQISRFGANFFTDEELVYAAYARCFCDAGMAYPKDSGALGCLMCSDILTGRAAKIGEPDEQSHTSALPFAFFEIKSENQPSACGATTRPNKEEL